MPVAPDSRFATLPIFPTIAPDGSTRLVIGFAFARPLPPAPDPHVVRQAESIDQIARLHLGAEGLWWRVLDANPLVYPLDLAPGDVLDLPAPGPATRVTRARSF